MLYIKARVRDEEHNERMPAYVTLVGRILLALIFVAAAPRHFTTEAISHARELGVPLANVLVPISGVMALVGGLGLLLGYRVEACAWLLVAFLVPVTLGMHAFWRLDDPQMIHVQQAMFVKNLAMIGALLLVTQLGGGPLTLDARLARAPVAAR